MHEGKTGKTTNTIDLEEKQKCSICVNLYNTKDLWSDLYIIKHAICHIKRWNCYTILITGFTDSAINKISIFLR